MKKIETLFALLLISILHTSCEQNPTYITKENSKPEKKDKPTSPDPIYTDSIGKNLIIQNSLPKGGMKYTASNGEVYNYVVFWTRIINETHNPVEFKIAFPENSFEIPSLPGKYLKILLPADTATPDKENLFNYGLTQLDSIFDNSMRKPSSLNRTVEPKESSGFYVIICCLTEGAGGTMRTALSLKGQDLFYRIKIDGSMSHTKSIDKEINCGKIK